MSQTIKYDEFPARFSHCFNSKCPNRESCLHYLINRITPASQSTFTCINPEYLKSCPKGQCPFFMSSAPEKYGKGISHLFDHIPYPVAINIKNKMIAAFGRTNYYRFRRKERLVSTREQELVKQFFEEEGITEGPRFDEYVNFYDLS